MLFDYVRILKVNKYEEKILKNFRILDVRGVLEIIYLDY